MFEFDFGTREQAIILVIFLLSISWNKFSVIWTAWKKLQTK